MDEERSTYKAITLTGSENYADWYLSISSVLLGKDLLEVITGTLPTATDSDNLALNKRKANKCFALLIQSLSPIILSSLPAICRDPLNSNAPALWTHLRVAYSAAVGARQAALVQELFRTTVQDGENPSEVLSRLQSAHSQLVFGGEVISDSLLAYAMTLALPESWTTQKQALWMETGLTSQKVASAIRAEWQRRQMEGGGGTALAAQPRQLQQRRNFNNRQTNQNSNRPVKHCRLHPSLTNHNDSECFLQGAPKPPQHANTAKADVPSTPSANVANYDSDGSAFITAKADLNNCNSNFIIDSGASHHMVVNASLFTNVRSLPSTKHIKIGDGTLVPFNSAGTLELGGIRFENVLVVPGLAVNLILVRCTPSRYSWAFSPYSATLYNSDNTALLTAHIHNDLYIFKT